MDHVPWVEKYRPRKFDDIVLEKNNKIILNNILNGASFPNLLFYGPPGTGKTTTIINLIDKYQEANDQKRKGLKIHLNASDDRGIDIIRNQINQFVNTKTLFGDGIVGPCVIIDDGLSGLYDQECPTSITIFDPTIFCWYKILFNM